MACKFALQFIIIVLHLFFSLLSLSSLSLFSYFVFFSRFEVTVVVYAPHPLSLSVPLLQRVISNN